MLPKDYALNNISLLFNEFAELTLHQLQLLERIIQTGQVEIDKEVMDELVSNERKMDKFEVKLTDKIINFIVLQKPVAGDLRHIMASYRMAEDLERIGDLVLNISKFIAKLNELEVYNQVSDLIYNMLLASIQMVEKSLLSFVNSDKEDAIWTIKNDAVVDEMNHKLMKRVIDKSDLDESMRQRLNSFINLKGIITNIERIADHATNIAEASIYALEGTDLRHKKLDD